MQFNNIGLHVVRQVRGGRRVGPDRAFACEKKTILDDGRDTRARGPPRLP